jgi:hypothetical protein
MSETKSFVLDIRSDPVGIKNINTKLSMQRITKFSAIIGFLAVMTFVIGLFMYMPTMTNQGASISPAVAVAFTTGGGGTGCGSCGGGGGGGNGGGGNGGSWYNPPTPPPPPPPPPVYVPRPVCALDAAPTTINRGDSVTLTWSTSNASSVSINQGIGSVSRNGSKIVSPQQNTTYTLTASGNGKTVTCSKTITVHIPVPDPVCTFDAAPTTINQGQSATLSWTTQNASSVSINQGIGSVNANGSRSVSPSQNTTYTLTASGNGKTVTCSKTITVHIPTPDPVCTFDAAPTTITNGQSSTLSWTTQNASSVSIDQGIGGVNANGSRSVSPSQNTTYTLTASGNGKTVTCSKTIVVNPVVHNLSCDSFTASPSSFGVGGGTTNLSWNTTGASSVSIDQGVGSVSVDGNYSLSVGSSKTFTLTASNGQNTVQCQTSVSVDTNTGCTSNCGGGGGGGTSRPSCKLFTASDRNIEAGDKVTLSWETRRGKEILIKDNHGEEILDSNDDDDVDEGTVVVYPKKDTTYTLKVEGKNRKTDSCTVKVNVDDEVTVTTVRDRQPVTTITFRDVPYTGFDAGPMLAGLFYALLAAWALVASYIIVVKKGSVMGLSLATIGAAGIGARFASKKASVAAPVVARAAVAAPANLPVATDEDEEEEEVVEDDEDDMGGEEDSLLQNRAFASGIILSMDALAAVKRAGSNTNERLTIIDAVIARAKESFPREDGWISLDKARISSLF